MERAPDNFNVDICNTRLSRYYGSIENLPTFRIVWSDIQIENRLGTYEDFTEHGVFIRRVTEVRPRPKYKQFIQSKWILERLTPVLCDPDKQLTSKLSYEPYWVFEDEEHLNWPHIHLLLDTNLAREGKKVVYKDPDLDKGKQEERIQAIQDLLFGNETPVGDALAHGEGVGYTGGPKKITPVSVKNIVIPEGY